MEYNKNMGKKYITVVLVLLILVLAGGGYCYWKAKMQKPVVNVVSPTESTQSANPYEKTNPFSNVKINPFE